MSSFGPYVLLLAAAFSALAAAAHLVCIAVGAKAYRLMGAGERMARSVEQGKVKPHLLTFTIAVVLAVWSAYALGAVRIIRALPLEEFVLLGIGAVLLARAFAFPLLRSRFPENTKTFWVVSSGACFVGGVLYTVGAVSVWARG